MIFLIECFLMTIVIPLNLKELATIFHFPYGIVSSQLKQAKSGIAPAPLEMGQEGILLGYK
jgi:hypothetical protein